MAERHTRIRAKQFLNFDLLPQDIKTANSPSDGNVLSYDAATQTFKWVVASASENIWNAYIEDEAEEAVSGGAYKLKVELSATIPSDGYYVVYFGAEARATRLFGTGKAKILFSVGSTEVDLAYIEQREYENTSHYKLFHFTSGTNVSFSIHYSSGSFGSVAYIRRARILLMRLQND